ncbi:hypothetical protein JOQ06_003606, partial [Pogonophryne albipinna]
MGKEQELLEAARTGNVAVVEKLLSGKRGILGSGSGSIPLPNLLSLSLSLLRPRLNQVIRRSKAGVSGWSIASGPWAERLITGWRSHAAMEDASRSFSKLRGHKLWSGDSCGALMHKN